MSVRASERIDLCACGRMPARGFSMLEIVVAMTLLGIALTGLFPLLATYSRQVQRLEKCSPQCGRWRSTKDATGTITWQPFERRDSNYDYTKVPSAAANRNSYPDQWHLVPADDPWMWKLGAAASLVPDDPTQLTSDPTADGTHEPYLRPFPYTVPTPSTLHADDDDDSNDAPYKEDETGWIPGPVTGDLGDSRRHPASGTPSWAATWTFTSVQPGWYEIKAIWPNPADGTSPAPDVGATSAAVYRLVDGNNDPIQDKNYIEVQGSANQTESFGTWNVIMTAYIPKRAANGNNGDTVKVQIQVPPVGAGFITADGMQLVAKPLNKIVRADPLAWTWSYDSQNSKVTQKVMATVTVTRPLP
jgi:prepilin-type N-terminal cleavage/methylation domain-containing protein